ncbi:MAG TPA: paraquat-inducible protein B, partial [Rhodopila sp.]|nr:paraquat-inducible protein B [Rhodopila sp.]
ELPAVSRDLQAVLRNTNKLLASMQAGYGENSDTHRRLEQLTAEATATLRSLRELTSYLDSHPGSVIWGRR